MAKRKKSEFEDESFMNDAEDEGGETFAESAGTPANAHAKKLAKQKSALKKSSEPSGAFYMVKNLTKVVKVLVKKSGVFQIYVGSLKRNKAELDAVIARWKKQGEWCEPHEAKAKIEEIRKAL